ncbi:hypothetical protein DUI87_09538 [Hirundo rustica rustica]|uniref:Uncharacterized protein n=1 Tax=Hirundo rustica rustica TaxID=333673 RepID=A0A3M0KMH2_HIRRU|nr:hypothetical protein DUI87_09538 [Hirundo rustica rustica]
MPEKLQRRDPGSPKSSRQRRNSEFLGTPTDGDVPEPEKVWFILDDILVKKKFKFSNLAYEFATENDLTRIMWYDSYKTAATSSEECEFYELGKQSFMIDCYTEVVMSSRNMAKINNK